MRSTICTGGLKGICFSMNLDTNTLRKKDTWKRKSMYTDLDSLPKETEISQNKLTTLYLKQIMKMKKYNLLNGSSLNSSKEEPTNPRLFTIHFKTTTWQFKMSSIS